MKLFLNDLGMISAMGNNRVEIFQRLLAGDRSGLILSSDYCDHPIYVGEIKAELPTINKQYQVYDCKNNRLLLAALEQIKTTVNQMVNRFGADRIGVVLGTSTSGVRNTELAIKSVAKDNVKPEQFHYKQQQLAGGADFLANHLNLAGPAYSVSTACSSSGRAFASATRLIKLGYCDAVIVGGADTLCQYTTHGFLALESVSSGLSKPFGQHRDGINLSEAVALFVLSKEEGSVALEGIGSTCDAYHFSAPDPEAGAVILAMQKALSSANKTAEEIDYINLHGTATKLNDAMESKAVQHVFGNQTAVSSSKGMTGHALGAAAAHELGMCWMLLNQQDTHGQLIANINDDQIDPDVVALNYIQQGQNLGRKINLCQSNSFAFGGNNISIIIGRHHD